MISVIDINDNPPEFTQEQYSVAVTEEVPVNGMLLLPLTVTANDADSDEANGAISYSISAGMLLMYNSIVTFCYLSQVILMCLH